MAEVNNLATGIGTVYITEVTGTKILSNLPNDAHTLRRLKQLAVMAAPISSNLIASGSVTFLTSGAGNVTAINVNGVNQMSGNEAGGGFTPTQLAANVAANINAFAPASGTDYTAISVAGKVTFFSTKDAGSTVNGHVVAMVTDTPANITSTDVNISGGSDVSKNYDDAHGMRFFLNDLSTAPQGDLTGATEITTQLIPQSLTGAVKTTTATIADGAITLTRLGQETWAEIDTEAAAATDELTTISAEGFTAGDKIYLRATNTGRVITIDETDNIDLDGGTTFVTAGYSRVIGLQLWKKGGAAGNQWYWFETYRSSQSVSSIADFRTSNIPIISTYGENSNALGTSGTTTFTANTSKQKQILTGTQTLTGNLEIALSLTDAKAGDMFIIENNAKITVGSFTFTIAGIVLTDTQALNGGHLILGYYDGAAWNSWILPNLNNSATRAKLEAADIADTTITAGKLETNLQIETISIPISFETNETGSLKLPVYYKGTINQIDIYVNKLIEATDDASVIVKNNAGTSMGTIVVTGGAAIGNNFNSTPSSNNTFVAGDVLTIETAKTTKGGKAFLTLKTTKT